MADANTDLGDLVAAVQYDRDTRMTPLEIVKDMLPTLTHVSNTARLLEEKVAPLSISDKAAVLAELKDQWAEVMQHFGAARMALGRVDNFFSMYSGRSTTRAVSVTLRPHVVTKAPRRRARTRLTLSHDTEQE